MPDARHIAFVGAMGAGKTTIGTRVATALNRPFVDNDEMLERTTGSSAAELAARDGVDALHRAEAAIVLDALHRPDSAVIAAAGSTIVEAAVREALTSRAWVVWLRADPVALVARLPESSTRPLLDPNLARLVAEQSSRRDALYAAVADETIDTGHRVVGDVVAQVLASAHECGLGV